MLGGAKANPAMKIGFIGLGRMGSGLAENIIKAGHELVLYNRSREKAEALSKLGARVENFAISRHSGRQLKFGLG
ncbi:MAG TPA: NAD(P)-binding domain-containing protein [Methylocystis sp.]|jgi:3-hydroxyisobutyrate dehydrogenase-like beta-hydroxyacid dehydrogenase